MYMGGTTLFVISVAAAMSLIVFCMVVSVVMNATALFGTSVMIVVAIVTVCIVVAVVMSENPRGRTNDSK